MEKAASELGSYVNELWAPSVLGSNPALRPGDLGPEVTFGASLFPDSSAVEKGTI